MVWAGASRIASALGSVSVNAPLEWSGIERCLDALLDLPPDQRLSAISRLADGDVAMQQELESLLLHIEAPSTRLDKPGLHILCPNT
jgi:hypothetical protein